MRNWIKGKRTYAAAVAMVLLAIAQWNGVQVPAEVWPILGGLGLGFLRKAVG